MPKPRRYVTRELELQLRSNRVITPSRPDPWFGNWQGDDDLTQQQLGELARRGLDPDIDRLGVNVSVSMAQLWVPLGQDMPWRLVACPILGRMSDGRLKVVAPNGERKLVWPTGDIRKPWPWPTRQPVHPNPGNIPA